MYSFANEIKKIRIKKGITLEQMADSLNNLASQLNDSGEVQYPTSINKSLISRWENGKTEPRMDTIRLISLWSDESVDKLLGVEKEEMDKDTKLFNELVKRNELNIKDLEKLFKVSSDTVKSWISGASKIDMNTLATLANYLNVGISSGVSDRGGLKTIISHEVRDYNYFDTAVSAGLPDTVEAFTEDSVEQIQLPDVTLGQYAGNSDIFITSINGESMNNIMPDKSLIAVKQTLSPFDLENGDIVVFRNGSGLSIKRFYNDKNEQRLVFRPDSTDKSFIDLVVSYEDAEDLQIYGKVVVYIVQL